MKNFIIKNQVVLAIAAAVVILGGLILTTNGDDSDNKPEAKPSVTKTTEAPEPELSDDAAEKAFLATVYAEYPFLSYDGDDQAMLDGGYRICNDITAGATAQDFVDDAVAEDIDVEMYGYVVGAAVGSLCPEHQEWLDNEGEVPSNA